MRLLTAEETVRVGALTSLDIPVALIELTPTGHSKSIMDATESVRRFLDETGLHSFVAQSQGQDFKKLVPVSFLQPDGAVMSSTVSLYRPQTKDGDPRIWIYGLRPASTGGDVIAIWVVGSQFWAANVTQTAIDRLAASAGPLGDLLAPAFAEKTFVVDELTSLLLDVGEQGFIPAPGPGDTMVGRVLETALGIAANSNKAPDFKGIEIKAFRLKPGQLTHGMKRRNLFAKTPDWALSPLKSSREIVDAFGYDVEGIWKLNCEVRATKFNTQGLRFEVDYGAELLREISSRPDIPEVAVWTLERLQSDLAAKHAETFWVGAEVVKTDGREHFRYVTVEHTQQPLVEQFGPLVSAGHISMDHLIKRKGPGAHERGPLFKIDNKAAELLFPAPRHFRIA
jgi:hypothetical protein